MVTFEALNEQNHKISELSHVLSNLIHNRSLCDTEVTSDLFFDYVKSVQEHLDLEDHDLYSNLLLHADLNVKNTANRFLSGSQEIKRVFKAYLKRWCRRQDLLIDDHDRFINETEEMFRLVLDRIQDETERLYPLIREIDDARAA